MSLQTEAQHAYALLIDGLPWIWVSNHELTQGWWNYDDRRVLPGLMVPDLKISLDLERGILNDDQATFKILDVDQTTLPGFFSNLAKDYNLLTPRLPPTEDPAPATSIGQEGETLTLHDGTEGCYLGHEAIGPNGERHYYSCWPEKFTAGYDHGGGGTDDVRTVYTTWSTGPYIVEGRRACLFRIFKSDPNVYGSFGWGTFDPEERPLWWGTLLQAGSVDGYNWSLQFSGPSSWLQKLLNTKAPNKWFRVQAELELAPSEDTIYISCQKLGYTGFSVSCGTITDTVADGSLDDVISSIQGHVTTAIATPGPGPDNYVWRDPDPITGSDGNIIWTAQGISVWTDEPQDYAVYLLVRLHWKVWRFLGYDPEQNLYNIAGPAPYFEADIVNNGYYYAVLSSTPLGKHPLIADGQISWTGDGLTNNYTPDYPGGVVTISGQAKQTVKITDVAGESIYLEGQTVRPAKTSVSINGQDCNATRWWVFRGQEQRAISPGQLSEPEDVYRVAKCSWVDQDGFMASSDGLFADLYIESWHDPRLFGMNFQPIDPQIGWAGRNTGEDGGIWCAPLAVFGIWSERNPATQRGTDPIDTTILRILASSGTAVVDPAADEPGDAQLELSYPAQSYLTVGQYGDFDQEIADLSLGLPERMVNADGIAIERSKLSGPLQEIKAAALGPVQAEDILLGLMGPGDWSISLERGRYGIFRRSAPMSLDDIVIAGPDFVITTADRGGEAGDPASSIPGLDLRPVQPFDRLTVAHTANPVEDPTQGQEERSYRARDIGSRARTGVRARDVAAPYLPAPRWWLGAADVPVAGWDLAFRELWEKEVAEWLAQPHRGVRGLRISRPKGQYIYPGQILQLSNLPGLLSPLGLYGMQNVLGRVISVTHEAASCEAVCDLFIQATPSSDLVWAPIARVVDDVEEPTERYDPDTRTFTCRPWDDDTQNFNLGAFAEPFWSSVGGNAAFRVLQYDGTTWRHTCSGFVKSADTTNGTIIHTAAGLTGTWYERMYAVIVIAPYDDVNQADWPKSTFHILGPKGGLPESRKMAP